MCKTFRIHVISALRWTCERASLSPDDRNIRDEPSNLWQKLGRNKTEGKIIKGEESDACLVELSWQRKIVFQLLKWVEFLLLKSYYDPIALLSHTVQTEAADWVWVLETLNGTKTFVPSR